ncbi:hypothetical protein BS47DRAFT_1399459 [Hydnum rufescens UP504]|uniref:Uncharacterized protein n=1 Tax=Hydnum rufescens UP504 TaxID=1448309 RepID=A0A9P6AIN2_9AGAM|nr:hypothetical protein BS47DRAFT_1399459 [Hydnum rufescens UP504]
MAKVEDWPVLKNGVAKTILHQELAAYIFEDDSEQKEKYALKPKEFAKSVGSCLKILRNEYKDLKATLNSTGHGVKPLDVEEGTSAEIKKTFPWWDEFHAFWMDLPNYNPIDVINSARCGAEGRCGGLLAGDGLDHEDEQENMEIDFLSLPPSLTHTHTHNPSTASYSHSPSLALIPDGASSTSALSQPVTPNVVTSKKTSTSCRMLTPLERFKKSQAGDQELFKIKQELEASMRLAKIEARERLHMEELKAQEHRDICQLEFQRKLQPSSLFKGELSLQEDLVSHGQVGASS